MVANLGGRLSRTLEFAGLISTEEEKQEKSIKNDTARINLDLSSLGQRRDDVGTFGLKT